MTEADVENQVTEKTFYRGKQLFQMGNVESIDVQDKIVDERPVTKISAQVQGSGWKRYAVFLTLEQGKGNILKYECGCPAVQQYQGPCKHCVAAMLRFVQVVAEEEKRKKNPLKKVTVSIEESNLLEAVQRAKQVALQEEKWKKAQEAGLIRKGFGTEYAARKQTATVQTEPRTDSGLYRILMNQGKVEQSQFIQKDVTGKVMLEPVFHDIDGRATVEFRIGMQNQMYVLKSVMEFTDLVKNGAMKRYGSKLSFYHHRSAFTDESIPLVEFLIEITNDFRKRGGSDIYRYYTRNDKNREIPLVGSNLDQFINVCEDRELLACINGEEESIYKICAFEPEIPLYIARTEAGINLHTKHFYMNHGAAYQYLYKENTIYKYPLSDVQRVQHFRQYMNQLYGRTAFIAQNDLTVFCRDLLPQLEKHYEICYDRFDPAEYLPDEVSFEIYLDAPQFSVIDCKLYAVYQTHGQSGQEQMMELQQPANTKYDLLEGYEQPTPHTERSLSDIVNNRVSLGEPIVTEKRDVAKEAQIREEIHQYFTEFDRQHRSFYLSGDEDRIYEFLTDSIPALQELGEVYISDRLKRMQIVSTPTFQLGVSMKMNLLELSIDAQNMSMEQLSEILSKYNRKKKYYRLKDGSFLKMEDENIRQVIGLLDDLHVSGKEILKDRISIPKYRALYMDRIMKEDEMNYVTRDREFRHLIRDMKNVEESDYEVPESLKNIMRDYQKKGFQWLKTLHHNGFGGILADDMGLGKTLQVISFLLSEYEENQEQEKHTLIVCPASLVYNWQSEITHFAPSLHTVLLIGDAKNRKKLLKKQDGSTVFITSYDLLKRDIEMFENMEFFCEVIDEAQNIKNHNTQAAKAVKLVRAGTRFALTGTPMENRLSELWSIFDYLMPGFLYGYTQFRNELEIPVVDQKEEQALIKLRRFITPFILRRLKKDVLKDLPDKLEEVVYSKMEQEQETLYQAHVSRIRIQLDEQTDEQFRESKIQILAELTKLRQICCDPSLLYENYKGEASKVTTCMDLCRGAIDGGHKVLIFSQFTSLLSLLMAEADKEGFSYYVLTGATPKEKRMRMVDAFNQDDTSIFFISLKAGGTGLNLTSADIVIHFDPWWNIAAQNQATDRTHRIGQKNVVSVYKLIMKDTIEEKIQQLQDMKQELAEQVLGGDNMDNPTFSKDELLELLQNKA